MGDWLQTAYATMNVTKPPFDKLEVRQAVNMAINRDRIVRLINNRAVPTGQVLPPAMPGYDPNNKGYSHDPKAARALLAKAGCPNGRVRGPVRYAAELPLHLCEGCAVKAAGK